MFRTLTTALRSTSRCAALIASLAVGLTACDGGGSSSGGRNLTSLPLDGTPGAGGSGAARSSSGHYFVRALDRDWHRACFICKHCKRSIPGGYVSDEHNNPYCNNECFQAASET